MGVYKQAIKQNCTNNVQTSSYKNVPTLDWTSQDMGTEGGETYTETNKERERERERERKREKGMFQAEEQQ